MSTSHDASAHAAMRAMMTPDPDLNQTDRCVYAYLVYRANGARMCWKTVGEIQADLGIGTRQTVCNATRKLREAGLIEVKHRRRDSNHYHILDPGRRLYPGSSGNGATEWQQPAPPSPTQDVKETGPLSLDVKETGLLDDVKETALLEPDDVKETALLEVFDVKETAQESFNQDKITKGKVTKLGASASRRQPARTPLPEDWQPNAEGEHFAANLGLNVPLVAARFSAWHRKQGTLSANWKAAWEYWCLDQVERDNRRDAQPEYRNGWFGVVEEEGWVSANGHAEESGEDLMRRLVHGHA